MIYVDDAGIQADVLNTETGKTHSSRWFHLISDQLDPAELHEFATGKLGLRRSYFQPGKRLGDGGPDPGGDHYDLTLGKRAQAVKLGARQISAQELVTITARKREIHRFGPLDVTAVAVLLAGHGGRFGLSVHDDGVWAAGIEWGKEAEDSPMAGAAAYGIGATAQEAVMAVLREAGWV